MGWTSYRASFYKNGKVDRKAEMDALYNWEEENRKVEVLKSSMVGSTYYAAVKSTNLKDNTFVVRAVICLTSTKWNDGMNFGYKGMDESMDPYCYDCPKSILNLLTPTDNENALEWRKKCEERYKTPSKAQRLAKLPIGTEIKFKNLKGEEIHLFKNPPAYQFKKPFWMMLDYNRYLSIKYIPENFEIVKK